MDGERGTAIREAELKVVEAATNHVCHVAPWFRLDRCAICKAVNALEKAKSGVADVESAAPDLKAENAKLQAELTVRRITCERLDAGLASANLEIEDLKKKLTWHVQQFQLAEHMKDTYSNLAEKRQEIIDEKGRTNEEYLRFCEELVKSTDTDLTLWRRRAQFVVDAMKNPVKPAPALDPADNGNCADNDAD